VLLTLSCSMPDATDLGFLLHKHPDRAQSFNVSVGTAHVFWPEATAERSTVALLLEVDPIALVRGRNVRLDDSFSLSRYANDRPCAASSMPGMKVRGREYLRLIYGPDYTEPANLRRLPGRDVGHKRSLASASSPRASRRSSVPCSADRSGACTRRYSRCSSSNSSRSTPACGA
jgi:hypothetical protein